MEFKVIDTVQLKAMLDGKQGFTLIDARTKQEYDEAHIIQALNIMEKNFDSMASKLPTNKTSLLVIYCNGVKCGKSKKVAAKAEAAGYMNIALYNEGFPIWEEKGMPITAGPEYGKKIETTKLTPREIKKMIDSGQKDFVLIDVREEAEYKDGHIPTAINIPSETFASKQDTLHKDKKIIVYCNTGSRSYMAYRKLIKMAYPTIYQALYSEWKEAKLPIEK
jgi:rhodanese-related sulfurtransferase